ncbi:MAG: heavy-metal-associated domain-containing protein [Parabacteroides sp.]
MKKLFISALLAASSVSLWAADNKQQVDTLVVSTTPQMHCANCENKIKQNIRFVKGVKKIETSIPEQKVTIIYNNSKTSFADFVKAFQSIGYEIANKKEKK